MQKEKKGIDAGLINELGNVISQLRDPNQGCPWDVEQTHISLIPFVLEEAYEVVDAIREKNDDHIIEELGDLLLQIMFHTEIASEENRFCLNDVIKGITKKLIRRHPHVFGNKKINNIDEVSKSWEQIKSSEQLLEHSTSPFTEKLKHKNRSQSCIAGTMFISEKVAGIGFEWENINAVWKKFDEEMYEFKEEIKENNKTRIKEEFGDVLFTLINIARWYKINPEESLSSANRRFLERFSFMEKSFGSNLANKSTQELEEMWEKAKDSTREQTSLD